MPTIEISDAAFEILTGLAKDAGLTPGEVVDRLIRAFTAGHANPARPTAVHAVYLGARTDATFTPANGLVVITSGPLTGRRYRTPGAARSAVITAADPGASPAGSGWDFWTLTDSNLPLRTLR